MKLQQSLYGRFERMAFRIISLLGRDINDFNNDPPEKHLIDYYDVFNSAASIVSLRNKPWRITGDSSLIMSRHQLGSKS